VKKLACIFPGQGSQEVGMADDLLSDPLSEYVFQDANETLGFDLTKLISDGPVEELTLTHNAQPAILATSFAAWKQFIRTLGYNTVPAYVAGHSLGEFTALAAAGSLEIQDALKLVRKRGKLMQQAVPENEGGMAALLGGDDQSLDKLLSEAAQGKVLDIANINAPGQTVLSGHSEAIDRAVQLAKKFGFLKAIKLKVSAPFHSSLMAPVREQFIPELNEKKFMPPICPIVHNVSALPNTDPKRMADVLARQIDSPVRWVESIQYMLFQDVKVFVEIGHGNVLQGLVKKIAGKNFDGIITGYSSQKDSEMILEKLNDLNQGNGSESNTDIKAKGREDLMKELENYDLTEPEVNGGNNV